MNKFLTSLFILLSFYSFSQVNLESGLQAYYPFNGNANDESGNGNNGVVSGSTLINDRDGKENNAYSFDGVDDYIQLPYSSKLEPSIFSISLWFKTTVSQNLYLIASDHPTSAPAKCFHGFYLRLTSEGKIEYGIDASSKCSDGFGVNSKDTLNDGKWHNIVATYDGNTMILYIDSIKNGEETNVVYGKTKQAIKIGDSNYHYEKHSHGYSEYFDGVIDDIYIYNRILTQEEITQLSSNKPNSPVVESLTECDNLPLILVAQGENIKWYSDEAKTNLVFEGNSYAPTSPQKGENNYWVTQTVNGIESDATKATLTVLASVKDAPKPTTTSLVEFCQGNVSSSEVSIGTIPNAESYEWTLTPQNAGTISGQGDKVTINWNVDFFGEAIIKVAGKNANCGLGKESEGLKFNILEKPNVASNLNNYTKYCEGQFIVLDAGSGYDSYLWNTGSTEQIEVIKSDFVGKGNHTYSVTATKGACSTTENVTVSVDLVTSAPSLVIEKSNVNVYPNPANDQLNIDFDNIHNEEVLTFELVNTNGNVVLEEKITVFDKNFSHSTNVNGISSGLYIIKIQGNTFSHQAKVIIE